MGDEKMMHTLLAKTVGSNALIVGLRAWDTGMKERQAELGIKSLSAAEVAANSIPVVGVAEKYRDFKSGDSFGPRCAGSSRNHCRSRY